MANPIGAFSANILARFNAAYSAGQGTTTSAPSGNSDTGSKVKAAAGESSAGGNNDSVILNLSAAAQQLLASLQAGGGQNAGSAVANPLAASQPLSLAAYFAGQNTTINGLNFLNGFGSDSIDSAGLAALGGDAIAGNGGAIQQFQQWLSQPLQANLERAIERAKESSPLASAKKEDEGRDKQDPATSDSSTAAPPPSINEASDGTSQAADSTGSDRAARGDSASS